jgi:hypothetical protein
MAAKKWKREDLVEAFRALGAVDPEALASSQLEEGLPQLHLFAFLKRLWDQVADTRSAKWIRQTIDQAEGLGADDPQAAAGPALRRMLDAGVDPKDVLKVVWCAQAEMIYNVAFQLDDPGFAVAQLPRHGGMQEEDALWGLFAVNEEGKPRKLLEGFHEIWASIVPPPKWDAKGEPAA